MFRHRLFGNEFKPTNTMNNQTSTQAPAQAGIEDLNGIFQEQLRGIVRDGAEWLYRLGKVYANDQITNKRLPEQHAPVKQATA